MSKTIRSGIRAGSSLAIIMIFLSLIGFLVSASTMIGSILGNTANNVDITVIPTLNLMISIAILGILGGVSAARSENADTWSEVALAGAVAGLISGAAFGAFNLLLGSLNANGVDLRDYLPQVAPKVIDFYMFRNVNFISSAFTYLALLIVSSTAGSLLAKLSRVTQIGKNFKQGQKNLAGALTQIPGYQKLEKSGYLKYVGFAVLALLLFVLPRVWGPYWNFIMGTVGIYIILGIGLNIIVGYSGQLVLGYVAFFAVGAYSFGLLTSPEPHHIMMSFWLALPISILIATLTGILLGLPLLNLRGDYLAIVTLGFGEIMRTLIKSDMLQSFTAGPKGIRNIAQPTLFGKSFSSDVDFMYMILIAVLVGIFIAYRIQNSRTGRAWLAINGDETVAQATGVNSYKYKLLALALGAAFAGLGGALFASRNQFTGPEDHIMMVSINVLCLVIVGGMGSIPGVILGAFVLKGLPEILRDLDIYRLLAFGALLVIMMIIRPEGLWPIQRPNLEPEHDLAAQPPDAAASSEGEV